MSEPSPLLAPQKPLVIAPRLWRDGRFVVDTWRTLSDDDPLPLEGRGIISLTRWRGADVPPALPLGVRLEAGETLDRTTDHLPRLAVIALAFPKFSDGRAYSTARRLREWGFVGEVRATGDVLLDQLPLMQRAGFDAFEIVHAATAVALDQGAGAGIANVYQSAAPRVAGGWRSRRAL